MGSLGNIDRYSPEQIRRLIEKLRGFLPEDPLGTVEDLETYEVRRYGVPYVVNIFWERLGISEFISSRLSDRQVAVDVDPCTRGMVLNRLMAPRSKLAVSRWASRTYLPGLDGGMLPSVHEYYRAMDYLLSMKEDLEAHPYHRLTDLLSLQLSMVFYDLTSSYLEGGTCPLARFGYSRDRRPDRKQIVLGLLVTKEGLPIAHEVYQGNITDKQTLPDIARLKERVGVRECIFVGDQGVMTRKNLKRLEKAGFRYILGYHKRKRVVCDLLLARYSDPGEY